MKPLVLTLGCLCGCHVGTLAHVHNLEVPRSSDNSPPLEGPQPVAVQVIERNVRVVANHSDANVELVSARVRTVQGSQCSVTSMAFCGAGGQCQVGVSVQGDTCVLLVRGISEIGHELDSYCHDLSHASISMVPIGTDRHHPVWERCLDDSR